MSIPLLCMGEVNCQRCRGIGADGEKFRLRWAKHLNPDLSCPFGKPLGWLQLGPSPADIERMLDAQGYEPSRDFHKDGCNCGGEKD